MGQYFFKLPDLGEGIVEAEIAAIHANVGDRITEDQPLIDMMTDKATVEIPSPVDGKILSVSGNPGDMVAVGSAMVVIEVEGEGNVPDTPAVPVKDEAPVVKEEPVPIPVKPLPVAPTPSPAPVVTNKGKPLTSPAVRRRALDQNVDLSRVPGSGPAGRISHQDLDDFIAAGGRISGPTKQKRTAVEEMPVIGIRRKIAERMELSKRSIPHYSYVEEIDVTEGGKAMCQTPPRSPSKMRPQSSKRSQFLFRSNPYQLHLPLLRPLL